MTVFRIDALKPPPGATAVGRRLAGLFRSGRSLRPVDPRLIGLVEILLAGAIAVVLAAIFWSVFGPIPKPTVTPRAAAPALASPVSMADSANPFRSSSEQAPAVEEGLGIGPDLAETTLNLVLHGTWTTSEGGAAFIKTPDEKQGRFAVGETITPGVILENVFRDQVVINRGGVRESLRLINREQAASASSRPPQASLRDSKITSDFRAATSIGQFVSAQPQADADGNVRLILQPSGDARRFEAMGLRPGDALVGVDNQPFGPDVAKNLEALSSLSGRRAVSVNIERDGVVMPVTIVLPQAAEVEE